MSKYYKEKFLIIRVNLYNLELPSGEIVKSDKVDLEKKHIDTNCMIFFESSFFLLPFWTTMTKELSVIGDRIMFKRFKGKSRPSSALHNN